MDFGFQGLVAHAALTRDLVAATIIESGTVSDSNYTEVGSSCISEVRAIEVIRDKGLATTPFLSFGDPIRIEGLIPMWCDRPAGRSSLTCDCHFLKIV